MGTVKTANSVNDGEMTTARIGGSAEIDKKTTFSQLVFDKHLETCKDNLFIDIELTLRVLTDHGFV